MSECSWRNRPSTILLELRQLSTRPVKVDPRIPAAATIARRTLSALIRAARTQESARAGPDCG